MKKLPAIDCSMHCTIYGTWKRIIVEWYPNGTRCCVYLMGGSYGLGVVAYGELSSEDVDKVLEATETEDYKISADSFCQLRLRELLHA